MTTGADPIRGTDFKTAFADMGLNEIKGMLKGANPGLVKEVGEHYESIAKELTGENGVLEKFEKAVNKVLETWHGKTADRFRKRAVEISNNIRKGSMEVQHTAGVMKAVATNLQTAVDAVSAVEEPDLLDRGLDFAKDTLSSPGGAVVAATHMALPGSGPMTYTAAKMAGIDVGRSDEGLKRDLAAGVSTRQALENHSGSLSAGKEAALRAAVPMEMLATSYESSSKQLKDGPSFDDNTRKPPQGPGGPGGVGPIGTGPTPGTGGYGGGAYNPTNPNGISMPSSDIAGPRTSGVPGGSGADIGTGLSGYNPGTGGIGAGGGAAGGLGASGLGGGSGVSASGSGTTGVPGIPGAIGAGGGGGAGARGSARPGMPGAAGAGAGGAGAGKNAGRGGSLARQRGGVVGAARGAGAGAQGGSGLHRSRGGSQAGKPGGGRGMLGAPGAHGASGNQENKRGERPDYLVEEEETWTPQRNVAPRVIE